MIDGDCMGRAYPEIQLVTLTLYGHSAAPLAVADEHGNVAIVDTDRQHLGGAAGAAGRGRDGRHLRRLRLSRSRSRICRRPRSSAPSPSPSGSARRSARRRASIAIPIAAVLETTGGFRLFSGRIVDVERRTQRGWALGETRIAGVDEFAGREMVVRFQNEHLVAIENDEIVVSVPDLIAILDTERGEPITTENLRYGFRVTVIGIPCDPKWRTPAGIALGGPRHFGYDIDFVPVEQRFAGERRRHESAADHRRSARSRARRRLPRHRRRRQPLRRPADGRAAHARDRARPRAARPGRRPRRRARSSRRR